MVNSMEKWPNFLIVGASKSGTTSLYEYLRNTEGIYMSPIKEPRYFHTHPTQYTARFGIREKSKYLKLFKGVTDEKAVGEASPSYLRDPKSAKLIHDLIPDARIVILLRDPIERALSQFLMEKTSGKEKRSFTEVIITSINLRKKGIPEFNKCLYPGLYTDQVRRFLDLFGTEQVKILIFEEFIKNPQENVKQILEFLGIVAKTPETIQKTFNPYGKPRGKISQYLLSNDTVWKLAVTLVPQNLRWKIKQNLLIKRDKKPLLLDKDRLVLEKFFREDVKNLQILLKRKIPWEWIEN